MPKTRIKTAWLQFGVIGDMILATPSYRQYRLEYPEEDITWICFDQYRDVIKNLKGLDSYIAWPLNPMVPRIQQELIQWAHIKAYAAEAFDRVVCSQLYPDHNWTARPGIHLLDQMADLAGVILTDRSLKLGVFLVYDKHPNVVTCNSRSNTQAPLWDMAQWAEFSKLLRDKGLEAVDGDKHNFPLPKWQRMIHNSGAYVGLDSGGTWLAATTKTPQICMYWENPTCPRWLTGLRNARVKDPQLTWELTEPEPKEVADLVANIILRGRYNVHNS